MFCACLLILATAVDHGLMPGSRTNCGAKAHTVGCEITEKWGARHMRQRTARSDAARHGGAATESKGTEQENRKKRSKNAQQMQQRKEERLEPRRRYSTGLGQDQVQQRGWSSATPWRGSLGSLLCLCLPTEISPLSVIATNKHPQSKRVLHSAYTVNIIYRKLSACLEEEEEEEEEEEDDDDERFI